MLENQNLQKLSNTHYLSHGSDLWILPDLKTSTWAQSLDWHLNFQLTKSLTHRTKRLSGKLLNIVEEHSVDHSLFEFSQSTPTLLATSQLLPNQSTVLLPFKEDLDIWLQSTYQIWDDLKKPSLRVFLPKNISEKSFVASFQKYFFETDRTHSFLLDGRFI